MEQNDIRYQTYLRILKEELVPAMGCTEPIAIAYGAAKAREVLGAIPDKVLVEASANIIKNVKSVVVPNTDGLEGIQAAAAIGIIGGKPEKVLEVISDVSAEDKKRVRDYLDTSCIEVVLADTPLILDIVITMYSGQDSVKLRLANQHTNIVLIEKNGEVIYRAGNEEVGAKVGLNAGSTEAGTTESGSTEAGATEAGTTESGSTEAGDDYRLLNVKDIVDFADSVVLEDVRDILSRQVEYNIAIAEEGLRNNYGANVGKVLLQTYGDNVRNRAMAMAAAASDARMGGCELPVVINSGSGNQGITASLPVIEYAKELGVDEEKLYRALVVSNLVTIHQKTGIGPLSAFCGAVCAGCGSGAGIAYLHGGDYEAVAHTLVNAVAIVSGIICDGAKASCAAKIAASVDAGILGYHMYMNGQEFKAGDGIVAKGVENTIVNVGYVGARGMKETDKEIISIMLDQC